MFDSFRIGQDVVSFKDNGTRKPISRVTLYLDDETYYTSGDDTGDEIVADCAHATQEMVDRLLVSLRGFQYHAYKADFANVDPSLELGDAVTVCGVYSVVAQITDNGKGYPTLSAPGQAELEDEYPAPGPMTQEFNRKVAEAYSRISKTAEEIRLEVVKKIDEDEANTLISAAIGKIQLSVSSKNGSTSFTLTDGEAELSAQKLDLTVDAVNISGKLTAEQIDATELKVDAANITGKLKLSQMASISFGDLSDADDVDTAISDAYDLASDAYEMAGNSLSEGEVTTLITSTLVQAPTIKGGEFYDIYDEGKLTLSYGGRFAWLTFESVEGNRELFSVGGTDYGGTQDITIMTFADQTIFQVYSATEEIEMVNVNIEYVLSQALDSADIVDKLKTVLGLS